MVAEETTNSVMSVNSDALERLLLFTLAAFAGAGAVLIGFATRLSMRIRRLRDEAESAIDARGHIAQPRRGLGRRATRSATCRAASRRCSSGSPQHHAYLESMAGRLSHELRTPIAVVRSSLENLKLAPARSRACTSSAPKQGLRA